MANAVVLDEDLKELSDFRYQCLVKHFGKEEADKLVNVDEDEEEITDPELLEIIENAGTLENDRQ